MIDPGIGRRNCCTSCENSWISSFGLVLSGPPCLRRHRSTQFSSHVCMLLPLLYSRSHLALQLSKPRLTQGVSSPMPSDGHPKHIYSTSITSSVRLPHSRARHRLPGFHHLQNILSATVGVVSLKKSKRKRRTSWSSMLAPSLENA